MRSTMRQSEVRACDCRTPLPSSMIPLYHWAEPQFVCYIKEWQSHPKALIPKTKLILSFHAKKFFSCCMFVYHRFHCFLVMGVFGDGDPMLKNLRSLFYKIQWGSRQVLAHTNANLCASQRNVFKQTDINANIQSPFTEVIYELDYF